MARPRKPEQEKYVSGHFKFPPQLWTEFTELVPVGERSAFIHEMLERALKLRRRQMAMELRAVRRAQEALSTEAEDELWRQAAERARHYYATDPEAREWAQFAGDTLDYGAAPDE
jgi:hypothetical protein